MKPRSARRTRRPQRAVSALAGSPDLNRSLKACWQAFRGAILKAPVGPLVVTLTGDSMRRIWMEHLARWSYYYDPVFLEAISERLTTGRELTPEQMEYLKHLKNTGDDLRNFFLLFSTDHRVPRLMKSLVKMVGQIRDQVRLGELQRANAQAQELLELMPRSGKIDWPKLEADPVTRSRFLRGRIARMRRLLTRERLTAYDFHEVKKDFRLIHTVFLCLCPEEAQLPTGQDAFWGTKKLIKKMHQVLLEQKYKSAIKYRDTVIRLPEECRAHLLLVLDAIRVAGRAGKRA